MTCFALSDEAIGPTDDADGKFVLGDEETVISIEVAPPSAMIIQGDSVERLNDTNADAVATSTDGDHRDTTKRWSFVVRASFVAVSVIGMWTVTFNMLAGGKIGYGMSTGLFRMTSYGVVDLSGTIQDALQAGQLSHAPDLHRRIVKRGFCWIAVGTLEGGLYSMWLLSYEPARAGTAWQPIPIMLCLMNIYLCQFCLAAGVMLQAHHDLRPNVMRWFSVVLYGHALTWVGDCTPYPLVATIGSVLFLLSTTFGTFILVAHIDHNAERTDVRNGYRLLWGLAMWAIQCNTLHIASLPNLGVLLKSGLLMIWGRVCIKTFVPIAKRCFGNDSRKLWTYALPAAMVSLELGPCLLFLTSDIRTMEFWALLAMQELNSVVKNTGQYDRLYMFVRQLLRQPVLVRAREQMDERREALAPCDNVGEIAAPIVLLVTIGFEAAFGALRLERAQYLANGGILGGWTKQRNREAPIMMAIVLCFRALFCWIEITVRAYQKRITRANCNDTMAMFAPRKPAGSSLRLSIVTLAGDAVKKRRSSMMVLFNRIVHSQDAPEHMKYMVGALLALQPILFVIYSAAFGKVLVAEKAKQ